MRLSPSLWTGRRALARTDRNDPDAALEGFAQLAEALAAAGDLRAVYRAVFSFARRRTATSSIFVALYDEARRQRVCVYAAGEDHEDDVALLPPMPMSGSPQSMAIATGQPVVTDDLQAALIGKPVVNLGLDKDPRLPQSSLAVPLIVLGRTIGAFEVQSVERAAYASADIVVMRLAAEIAALATDRLDAGLPDTVANDQAIIRRLINDRAFTPVFQPITDLGRGSIVGYEALTRFSDGTPPDVRFVQASACGLGLELESATLVAVFQAAATLPRGAWLNLNVSPALVLAGEPLAPLLERWARPTVLELTEHVAVNDYGRLRAAIKRLGEHVRLAVDDAGAGFSSFRHILELAPDYVKLDRTIISGIDADPARQAFVAGMRHFAVTTGCELIAEGIETEREVAALRMLGVGLGQGYHLSKPSRAPQAASVAARVDPPLGRDAPPAPRGHVRPVEARAVAPAVTASVGSPA